jgi:hypothetical protein
VIVTAPSPAALVPLLSSLAAPVMALLATTTASSLMLLRIGRFRCCDEHGRRDSPKKADEKSPPCLRLRIIHFRHGFTSSMTYTDHLL